MSDPHVVLVTIDFAPWDSDSENEICLYEFSGPGEAQMFYHAAVGLIGRETDTQDLIVQVTEPEPVIRFGDADAALMALRDWIGEEDDDTAAAAVPTGD